MVTGSTISSTWANNTLSDIAFALTASIANDGQTPITADITLTNNKITDLAVGTAPTDAINLSQAYSGSAAVTTSNASAAIIALSAINQTYAKVGSTVILSGQVTITVVSANTNATLDITLPVTSAAAVAVVGQCSIAPYGNYSGDVVLLNATHLQLRFKTEAIGPTFAVQYSAVYPLA